MAHIRQEEIFLLFLLVKYSIIIRYVQKKQDLTTKIFGKVCKYDKIRT